MKIVDVQINIICPVHLICVSPFPLEMTENNDVILRICLTINKPLQNVSQRFKDRCNGLVTLVLSTILLYIVDITSRGYLYCRRQQFIQT